MPPVLVDALFIAVPEFAVNPDDVPVVDGCATGVVPQNPSFSLGVTAIFVPAPVPV